MTATFKNWQNWLGFWWWVSAGMGIGEYEDHLRATEKRRRTKQLAYNEEHGITPTSVARAIVDIMEGARAEPELEKKGRGKTRKVAEPAEDYAALPPEKLAARLKALEQQMYQHARDLEFEEAGRLRDQIQQIKALSLAR